MPANSDQDTQPVDPMEFSWERLPEKLTDSWDQIGEYDPRVELQLTLAKNARIQAENERQQIAEAILEATRQKCRELVAGGNRALQNAKHLEASAEWKCSEAQEELKLAQAIKASVEAEREQTLSNANQQVQELLDKARVEAEHELIGLKEQATLEAQRILAQARAMRKATREELEAQRIYAEAARLKAWSHDILDHAGEQPDCTALATQEKVNGNGPTPEVVEVAQNGAHLEPDDADSPPREPASLQGKHDATNGRKSSRGAKATR